MHFTCPAGSLKLKGMFKHKIGDQAGRHTRVGWYLLSFLAGDINAGGFLSCGKFVSHITGFATLSGISLQRGRVFESLGFLSIPAFFLGGVMLSGYLTEYRASTRESGEKFAPVMGLVAALMAVVTVLGYFGWFGEFGASRSLSHQYVLLALVCAACGLQNAAITSATGATIRTTHLTGLVTDLGLGLVRSEVHPVSEEQRTADRATNKLRMFTVGSFTLGSAGGALAFAHFQYLGFLLPMALALYFAWHAKRS